MKTILLNPGPVTLSDRVRQAMLRADLCHRESEFSDLQNGLREKLLRVYALDDDTWAVALMTGSGTAAVEAMISSLAIDEGQLLVVENGVYGERMSRIAERYGIAPLKLSAAWGEPINLEVFANTLQENPQLKHVAVVHHETTTGRLNELEKLDALCKANGVAMLVDGVSSFGAEAIDFHSSSIVACAATANKCLHGVPGTCFVIVARAALAQAEARSVYLDLAAYISAQDQAGTPFTQSIQTFYALDEALDELTEQGGASARRATYRHRMDEIRTHLIGLGIKPLLDDQETSCVLHGFELPPAISYQKLHDDLKAAGFVIYAGQGPYAETIFRISMMGEISNADVQRLKSALSSALS